MSDFRIINLDKKEFMDAEDYGSGKELLEFSYITKHMEVNDYMRTLSHLINNEWKGDRVLVASDDVDYKWANYTLDRDERRVDAKYLLELADEFSFLKEIECSYPSWDLYKRLYKCENYGFKKYTKKYFDSLKRYLCNSKTKQYMDLGNLPFNGMWGEDGNFCIYPLPLLISMDGRVNSLELGRKYVSSWADTSAYIFFSDEKPEDYKKFEPDFDENHYGKVLDDYFADPDY